MKDLVISTPGRICLFGEHQDYLGLPVLTCAINLRLTIQGCNQEKLLFDVDLLDIGSKESIPLQGLQEYRSERDYLRSVLNTLCRHGFTFSQGFRSQVRSDIPISAGTSSSSAFVVGWTNFLAQISDQRMQLSPNELSRYAYEAEVLEFGEPGGMMDQSTAAYGGMLFIEFHPKLHVERLPSEPGSLVLGDSGQPKDTKSILARVKGRILEIVAKVTSTQKNFSLQTAELGDLDSMTRMLLEEDAQLLRGTIRNRDITREAQVILKSIANPKRVGQLLIEHQEILRDVLKISTPKIDRIIEAALNAGAYGAKINGSGGGGCMFALAPENPERVAEAVMKAGGTAHVVYVDTGSRVESK